VLNQARLVARAVRHDWRLLLDYARILRQPPASLEIDRNLGDVTSLAPDEVIRRVQELLGTPVGGPALELVRESAVRVAERADSSVGRMDAGDECLGELLYVLVRVLEPVAVVETGVGPGLTSAYLLAGLADNHVGVLHSVDLPIATFADHVGVAVPQQLRSRWRYHWGAARRLLPGLLGSLGPGLKLAFLDGDLRYAAVRWELEQLWPRLEPGGWVVVNEAQAHTAVRDVGRAVGAGVFYARQMAKPGWTGLLRKH
jgi:predicted O-methyltransferase YrrM